MFKKGIQNAISQISQNSTVSKLFKIPSNISDASISAAESGRYSPGLSAIRNAENYQKKIVLVNGKLIQLYRSILINQKNANKLSIKSEQGKRNSFQKTVILRSEELY